MSERNARAKEAIMTALRLASASTSKSGRRHLIDGQFYRMRRGRLVLIPDTWVGVTSDRWPFKNRAGMHGWPKKRRKMYTANDGYPDPPERRSMKLRGTPRRVHHGQEDW